MQVFSLEQALENPLAVQKLVLQKQDLKAIPSIIWRAFPNMEILDLSDNEIKSVPRSISKLKNLKRLILANNRIVRLPDSFEQLIQLKFLDLNHNRIQKLEFLPSTLETIDLSNNKIKVFPEVLGTCSQLVHLDLSKNRLESISNLDTIFPSLQYLNLSHCKLNSMGKLPTKLYALLVAKNRLNKLPEDWKNLINLQRLDVSSNPIAIGLVNNHKLKKLSYLDVRKTKIKWRDIENLLFLFPNLQHSFGGLSAAKQRQLSALFEIIPNKPVSLSNSIAFKILKKSSSLEIKTEDLGSCLTEKGHPDLAAAAMNLILKRFSYQLPRNLKAKKICTIGNLSLGKNLLASRLEQQGALLDENITNADIIILGHSSWPKGFLRKSISVVSEHQLITWLDKKEGRYLSYTKDKNKIDNIHRMIQSADTGTFMMGMALLNSWGTPKALLEPLFLKWLHTNTVERKQWENNLLPYLPIDIKVILYSTIKTRLFLSRGWTKNLWKCILSAAQNKT